MRVFLAKSWSDFRSEWLFGLLFFAVVVVAAATTVLALVVRTGSAEVWDDTVAATNGADVVLVGRPGGTDFSPLGGLAAVAESDGPHRVAGPFTIAGGTAPGVPLENQVSLFAGDAPPEISRPRIVSGGWPTGPDELLVEHAFAAELGLEHGTAVTLRQAPGAEPVPFTVAGTAVNSVACPFVECDPQLAYVTPAGLGRLAPPAAQRDMLLLRLAATATERDIVTAAEASLAPGALSSIQLASATRRAVLEDSRVTVIGYAGMAVVALAVVGIALVNFVALRVGYLRKETALLRALGLTPGQATRLMLGQALVGGLNAFVAGAVIGVGLAALVLRDLLDALDAGALPPLAWQDLALAFVAVEALVAVAAFVPTWRGARRPLVADPEPARGGALAAAAVRVPPPVRVGLAQVTSSRPRLAVAVTTLALGFAAVVLALGAVRTLDAVTARPELLGDPFDMLVRDSSFTIDEARRLFAGDDRVAEVFTRGNLLVRLGGDPDLYAARTLGGDYAAAGWSIGEGRMVAGPGEAVAAYGLMRATGLRVGDRVAVDTGAEVVEVEIVGRHHESNDSGEILMLDGRSLGARPPESVLIQLRDRSDLASVVADLQAARPGLGLSIESPGPGALGASLRPMSIGLAATLSLLALANLAGTALLAVREHRRDIGVLKAIGLTPRGVLAAVASANAVVAALAAGAGVVVGLAALRLLLAFIGIEVGTGPDFGLLPNWWATASLVPLAVVAATAVTMLVGWRASRISPTDVLRDE